MEKVAPPLTHPSWAGCCSVIVPTSLTARHSPDRGSAFVTRILMVTVDVPTTLPHRPVNLPLSEPEYFAPLRMRTDSRPLFERSVHRVAQAPVWQVGSKSHPRVNFPSFLTYPP